jgi:hypothetical protein
LVEAAAFEALLEDFDFFFIILLVCHFLVLLFRKHFAPLLHRQLTADVLPRLGVQRLDSPQRLGDDERVAQQIELCGTDLGIGACLRLLLTVFLLHCEIFYSRLEPYPFFQLFRLVVLLGDLLSIRLCKLLRNFIRRKYWIDELCRILVDWNPIDIK